MDVKFSFVAAVTALLSGLLAGCATATIERLPGPRAEDAIDKLDHATRRGAIQTTIIGNPFQGDKKAFDDRVLRLMRGENRGKPASFVATRSPRTDPSYKVVVAFNAATGVTAGALCGNRGGTAGGPFTTTLTMSIAFCQGETPLSGVAGRVSGLKDVGDSKFAALVSSVTRVMVNPRVSRLPVYPHYDGPYTHHDENEGD